MTGINLFFNISRNNFCDFFFLIHFKAFLFNDPVTNIIGRSLSWLRSSIFTVAGFFS